MRRIIFQAILITTLVTLAGCSGFFPDSQEQATIEQPETTDIPKQGATTSTLTPSETVGDSSADDTPTPSTTTSIQTITVTAVHTDLAGKDLNNEASNAVEFLSNHPELNQVGLELEYDAEASPDTADIVIDYQRHISECGSSVTLGDYSYCSYHLEDREDLQEDYTVQVRGVYTSKVVESQTIQALAMIVGEEEPAKHRDIPNPELRYPNPWSKDPVVVNISYETSVERQYTEEVRNAVSYWESNDEEYGNYTANWSLKPNANEADLTITVQDYLHSCGFTFTDSAFVGCADTLSNRDYVESAEITIVDGLVPSETTDILKHEFGHVYGLEHGQDPMPLMKAIEEEPAERLPPHDIGTVTYYIDYNSYTDSEETIDTQVREALEYYESTNEHTPDNLTFIEASSKEKAEIVIERNISAISGDGGSTMSKYGFPYELDGGEYRHLNVSIQTQLERSDTLGWHIGYWLGYVFSDANSQDELPPPFRDADSYDDRVEWWD